MKKRKNQIGNIIFILVLAVIVFTPIRTYLQVAFNRIFAFAPSIENHQKEKLENFNWELKDVKGQNYNLKEAEGQVIIINEWATWCPPCISEMPSFQTLYDEYKDKINFLFITNDSFERVHKFLEEKRYTFPVYHSVGKEPKQLESSRIPMTFLISKKGQIILKKEGVADWNDEAFKKVLDSLILEKR